MRVQRLVMPNSGAESWTLLGDDGRPVEPAERFLAFLGAIERSPNTIKAYAHADGHPPAASKTHPRRIAADQSTRVSVDSR